VTDPVSTNQASTPVSIGGTGIAGGGSRPPRRIGGRARTSLRFALLAGLVVGLNGGNGFVGQALAQSARPGVEPTSWQGGGGGDHAIDAIDSELIERLSELERSSISEDSEEATWSRVVGESVAGASLPLDAPGGVERWASSAVARLAAADLSRQPNPEQDDFALAATLLGIAATLAADDAELLRLRIEATARSGAPGSLGALYERLVRLDPSDEVAWLRLIAERVGGLQTVEDRLRMYESLVGRDGDALSAAVRSRLALDAALLYRERGDQAGFLRLLGRAIELDVTNKDAASFAATMYANSGGRPEGRLELLIALLYADPLDARTSLAIARELASSGVYDAALRYYAVYAMCMAARGETVSPEVEAERAVAVWAAQGAQGLLNDLQRRIDTQRAQLRVQIEEALGAGLDPAPLGDPEDIRLPLEAERVRVLAADAIGDNVQRDVGVREITGTFARLFAVLGDPERRPEGIDDAEAARLFDRFSADRMWLSVWVGFDLERSGELIARFRGREGIDDNTLTRLEGWLSLHRGEYGRASRLLEAASERGDPLADLGLARLAEFQGRRDDAAAMYGESSRALAGSAAGVWARQRAIVLTGQPPEPPAWAGAVRTIASAVPAWLERVVEGPTKVSIMRASLVSSSSDPGGAIEIVVMIRNEAPIPLGVSPEGPIRSRILASPSVEVGTMPASQRGLLQVLSAERRLRLMPRETLELTFRADSTPIGGLLDALAPHGVRVRWRFVQGFEAKSDGTFGPGPYSRTTESGVHRRNPSAMSQLTPEELAIRVRTATDAQLCEAAAVMTSRVFTLMRTEGGAELLPRWEPAARAIIERLNNAQAPARLMIASILPQSEMFPLLAEADTKLLNDPDGRVRAVATLTRPGRELDRRLEALQADRDERVAQVATLVASRNAALAAAAAAKAEAAASAPATTPSRGTGGSRDRGASNGRR